MKYLIALIVLAMCSCSALEGEQKTNVNDIIKSQEIKRVSRAEIMMHAEKVGKQIEAHLLSQWAKIDSCPLLFSYSDSLMVAMEVMSVMGMDKSSFQNEIEKQTFEAYQYNLENNLAMTASTQTMGDDKVLYNFATKLGQKNLLECKLDSTQTLVMWSLIIPVKSIVNSL